MTLFDPSPELIDRHVKPDVPVCAFIHDLPALTQHAQNIVSLLPEGSEFFYAIKANSDPIILQALKPIVAGFEVASAGEIRKVRTAVGPDVRIIMGGPARTASDFETALAYGVERVHIESVHVLHLANAVAAKAGKKLPILLRINLSGPVPGATITMGGQPTQFGIEEAQLAAVLDELSTCPHLSFEGFHLHTISNNIDAEAHSVFCRAALQRVKTIARRHDLNLKVVNLGGGWGVDYADLDRRFDARGFADRLRRLLKPGDPVIQFECGRIVVAYSAVYVSEIVDIKTNHGQAFALLRGGSHHFRLPSAWRHRHPFKIIARERWPWPWPRQTHANGPITITGELCTPKDILLHDEPLSGLRTGDLVCFLAAGAYGWDISHRDFLSNAHPERLYLTDPTAGRSTAERERIPA